MCFFPFLSLSLSVSLSWKTECVGGLSRHAWLHTVRPPEQQPSTSTRALIQAHGRALRHTEIWHTRTWTHTSESDPSVLDFRLDRLSLPLSLSHVQMFTFLSHSLTLRDHYRWHIEDTDGGFETGICVLTVSLLIKWTHSQWPTLLWCSPGRWLQCPPGTTAT